MGSVAFGLGKIGDAIAQAKELQRKEALEKIKLAIEQGQLGVSQQYADTNKQRFAWQQKQAMQPQIVHTYRGVDGKIHNLVRDPATNKITDQVASDVAEATPQTDKLAAFKQAFGRDPSEEEKKLLLGLDKQFAAKYSSDKPVKDPTSPTGWSWKSREENTGEVVLDKGAPNPYVGKEKPGVKTGGELPESTVKALANKWTKEGIKPPAKYQAQVEEYMEDNKMSAKVKLSNAEQRILDLTKQMEPKVSQLKKLIEDNKLMDEGGLGSMLGQQYQMGKYRMGLKPDQIHSDLIKTAAGLQVMGAGPWMQMGRGKYLFDTIKTHLPSPTDTPALMYDKANFLQSIIDEARESLPKAGADTDAPVNVDQILDQMFPRQNAPR